VPLNLAGTFPHINARDDLPAGEHGFFLDQYREAVDNVRDPAGWKQLRAGPAVVEISCRRHRRPRLPPGTGCCLRPGQRRYGTGGRGPGVQSGLVTRQPWPDDRALRQMQGLPSEPFDVLVRTLARSCDDLYYPVFSTLVSGRRVADLDDFGLIKFIADEMHGLVRVCYLAWTG
jgi:hypothetical protein